MLGVARKAYCQDSSRLYAQVSDFATHHRPWGLRLGLRSRGSIALAALRHATPKILARTRRVRKAPPGVVRVQLLRLARGGREQARLAARVRGQVSKGVQNVEARGTRERAELLAELVEVGAAPHEHGAP